MPANNNHGPAAGVGHNRPPLPTPDELQAELAESYSRLAGRVMALVDATDRLPARVEDEQTAAKLGDFVGQCRAANKAIAQAHAREKEDYLRGGQTVDRYFRGLRGLVEEVVAATTKVLEPFMAHQREVERHRLEQAEAERMAALRLKLEAEAAERKELEEATARAEAERAAEAKRVAEAAAAESKRLAERTNGTPALEASRAAEEARLAAELSAQAAAAPVAPVHVEPQPIDPRVRIPGADGRVLAKSVWAWEYIDPSKLDLGKVRDFLDPEAVSRALDAAVKAGLRDCRGVRIFETTKVVV
jgi:hypothetical protein